MKNTRRLISGSVLKLRCRGCGSVFSLFQFDGENDLETLGLVSVSTCIENEIIIVEALQDEWNSLDNFGASMLETRIAHEFNLRNARVIRLLRSEATSLPAAGTSFETFRRSYVPPVLVFSCPCCEAGESSVIEDMTLSNFEAAGGKIFLTGRLVLSR